MDSLTQTLFDQICAIPILDPHSHINPHAPASKSLNDILGYHYYTELAHSAGLPKSDIDGVSGLELAERVVGHLRYCTNTLQYSWLVELCQAFLGHQEPNVTPDNLRQLYDLAAKKMAAPDWTEQVFRKTKLDAIFLTNDFDDPLEGFDTTRYIPCLRTDDLLFKLGSVGVRERFEQCTGLAPWDWTKVCQGLDRLFAHFLTKGARACAVSLPPDFAPVRPGIEETEFALRQTLRGTASAHESRALSYAVIYALADRCEEHKLPFDLMVGVWRNVYEAGVFQGQDLYDKTTSLYQYRRLFNDKPAVTFPISVLTSNQNQELVSYTWIFPNVVTNGHWWYSNVPAYIEPDLRARLEAAPWSKQIGYYSDAYKLEFVLPKWNMYRRCLANVLARDFVIGRKWTETQAIQLAKSVLRDNVERLFPSR